MDWAVVVVGGWKWGRGKSCWKGASRASTLRPQKHVYQGGCRSSVGHRSNLQTTGLNKQTAGGIIIFKSNWCINGLRPRICYGRDGPAQRAAGSGGASLRHHGPHWAHGASWFLVPLGSSRDRSAAAAATPCIAMVMASTMRWHAPRAVRNGICLSA